MIPQSFFQHKAVTLQDAAIEVLQVLKEAKPGFRRAAKEILMRALAVSKNPGANKSE